MPADAPLYSPASAASPPDRREASPRVTVLMAVRDGERYLGEAIESVLGQTYPHFELLIVDDGSTDRSREIVRSFADPRIRLIVNERPLGLAGSLNRGLQLAEGEYVARQDADDLSEPERLARQVEFLDAHPEVALLGSWYTEIDADGRSLGRHELPCDGTWLRWMLLFFCPFVHSAVMLRRSAVLARVGLYDESLAYALDYELWLRIARVFAVANLDEYLVRWRAHPASMTSSPGEHLREGDRLRVANVARLLGWPETEAAEHERRYLALHDLFRGGAEAHTDAELLTARDDLLRLQRAFCHEAGLSASECRQHPAALRLRIARNLAAVALTRRRAGMASRLRLLAHAVRLLPAAARPPSRLFAGGQAPTLGPPADAGLASRPHGSPQP